jgi:uncharacterized membrane protein YbhN (UPF0104 family)
MIWVPKFLMHKVSLEKLGTNPITGGNRNAYNLGPLGVWYTELTDTSTLEQEKAEVWLATFTILLTLSLFIPLAFNSLWWFTPLSIIPVLIYPICYFVKFPYSAIFRRFFEIRTHAIELRHWKSVEQMGEIPSDSLFDWKVWFEARSMSRYKFYDLQLSHEDVERRLRKLLKLPAKQ